MGPSDEQKPAHQLGSGDRSRIGTSGWQYPHWAGRFYPEGTSAKACLCYYAGLFETVEINSSFYRLPSEQTLRDWANHTPPGFVFASKASQYITHRKDKLGPVLFQLPPRWRPNFPRLEAFLEALPQGQRFTFEFRDPRWHTPGVMGLLERYGSAFCCFDLGGSASPIQVTTDFAYIRLHGPDAPYRGSYGDACLADWAARIAAWQRDGLDVCYFDNDERAYAPRNARSLIEKLSDLRADATRVRRRRSGKP